MTPAGPPTPPPTPPPGGFVVSITPTGVSPQVLHVWEGRKAGFVNEDTRPHAVFADPHPAHSDCSGLLSVGTLAPGERRDVANLPIDACYYHDEGDPGNRAFQGLVLVH